MKASGQLKSYLTLLILIGKGVNPCYAVGVIFYGFLASFGTRTVVFPEVLENVDFETARGPDQVT